MDLTTEWLTDFYRWRETNVMEEFLRVIVDDVSIAHNGI